MAAWRLRPALRWLPLAGAAPVCGFNGWPTHLANVEDRLCTVGRKKKLCADRPTPLLRRTRPNTPNIWLCFSICSFPFQEAHCLGLMRETVAFAETQAGSK